MRYTLPLIVLALLVASGCAGLDQWATDNPETMDKIQQGVEYAGAVAAPITGGLSSLVAGIIAVGLPTVVAINRHVLAYKTRKAAAAVVQSIETAKTANGGTLNFNDPKTIEVLNLLQGESGKALVDSIQGKNV